MEFKDRLKTFSEYETAPAGQSITEGTLILVDTEVEVAPGKLVVAKLPDSNEATFKKLARDDGRPLLKPLNPSYPIEAVDENCRIVGVVVQACRNSTDALRPWKTIEFMALEQGMGLRHAGAHGGVHQL